MVRCNADGIVAKILLFEFIVSLLLNSIAHDVFLITSMRSLVFTFIL